MTDASRAPNSSIEEDARKLVAHIERSGIDVGTNDVSYSHMGVLIADAILQQRRRYKSFVLPRLERIANAWPEATTTSAFLKHLDRGEFSEVAGVRGRRPEYIRNLAVFLNDKGIESPDQLHAAFDAEDASEFLRTLLRVKGVGPKTRDYLGILSGSKRFAAVDSRFQARAEEAGVSNYSSYKHLAAVVEAAAGMLQCEVGDLDKAIWAWEKKADATA